MSAQFSEFLLEVFYKEKACPNHCPNPNLMANETFFLDVSPIRVLLKPLIPKLQISSQE